MKPFKPQLLPNTAVPPDEMKYPLYASYKYDGVRACIRDGQILSRSLKPAPNKYLYEYFKDILQFSKIYPDFVIDAEFYHPDKTHGEIVASFRSHEEPDLEGFVLVIFDCVNLETPHMPFEMRNFEARRIVYKYEHCVRPYTVRVRFPSDVEYFYEKAIEEGLEGLVLYNPEAGYKFGRITAKSGDGYKMKPLETYDSKIIRVEQGTVVDPTAPKKINELGYSETSKKKDDRLDVPKAKCFVVDWNGQEVSVNLSMTDEEKEEVWANQDKYIGAWVEWKAMPYGMKDKPRHPRTVRMRWDKE